MRSDPHRVTRLWESYLKEALPPNASAVQVQETRRAFYAGAFALFAEIINNTSGGPEPTEEDLQILDDLAEEGRAFARAVAEGQA